MVEGQKSMNFADTICGVLIALPELVSARDLVKVGMYRTEQGAYAARQSGKCPPYFRIPGRGIVYPKQGVIDFLRTRVFAVDQNGQK